MIDIFQGSGAPLTGKGLTEALDQLKAPDRAVGLWSVISVETRGFGFLPDRRPKILFERHIFHRRTGGVYDAAYPNISSSAPGGYAGGAAEYLRLKRAMLLDRRNALESASWGMGQIMGFNATGLGYTNVEAMIAAFKGGEDAQLEGCARFIAGNPPLAAAFRSSDWARVAFFYNGSSYAQNGYDRKLAASSRRYETSGTPDVELRAAQARLTYLGYDTGGVDGELGPLTRAALNAFQSRKELAPKSPGVLDDATSKALALAAGV